MFSSMNAMIWKAQDVLHKKPQVVPGTLLLLASSLVVYRHMTHETDGQDVLKTFLAMILVQMLPLVALEVKITSCADPVGLFCKFAGPVTLTHGIFLVMRVCMFFNHGQSYMIRAILGSLGAFICILQGFRQHWTSVFQYHSVWNLIGLCLVASVFTQTLDASMNPPEAWMEEPSWAELFTKMTDTAIDYIEICAFVPAVWMVYREDQNAGRFQVDSIDTKRVSTAFFLFLVGFYLVEDVLSAYQAWNFSGLASAAHLAHFVLLADFACYVLAHIYNPEKLVGELRKWLPVDFSHEV